MFQVTLVPNKGDDDVVIGVVPQFLQPPVDVGISSLLRDIVHQKRSNGASIVTIKALRQQVRSSLILVAYAAVIALYRS